MNCSEVQNVLIKMKTDSFQLSNNIEIYKHIESCRDCKQLYKSIMLEANAIKNVKEAEYEIDEAKIIQNVLREIENSVTVEKNSVIDSFLSFAIRPSIRFASLILLTFLAGWYFSVEYIDHLKIVELEKRMKIENGIKLNQLDDSRLSLASFGKSFNSLFNGILSGDLNSERIRAGEYAFLLKILIESEMKSNKQFGEFIKSIQVDVNNGIDENELEDLINNLNVIRNILETSGGK